MSGSRAPAELWSSMMMAALEGVPAREPTPYVPRQRPDTLLDHLANILGVSRGAERPSPPPAADDDIAALIGSTGGDR